MEIFQEPSREEYERALANFDVLVSASTVISQGASGRPAESGRHYHASLLYTRLCGWEISILLNLPGNRLLVSKFEHWDFSTIASLSRDLIECYLAFFYLCVEPIGEDEWECRWNIFNLHDCLRRRRLFEYLGAKGDKLDEYEKHAEELRGRLRNNARFLTLTDSEQKDCLKAKKLYLQSQDELIEKIGVDPRFYRGLYMLLSSHVHTFPLGFYRIGSENRGRGLENTVDRAYICGCLETSAFFVRRAAKEMVGMFPGADREISETGRAALAESNFDGKT